MASFTFRAFGHVELFFDEVVEKDGSKTLLVMSSVYSREELEPITREFKTLEALVDEVFNAHTVVGTNRLSRDGLEECEFLVTALKAAANYAAKELRKRTKKINKDGPLHKTVPRSG